VRSPENGQVLSPDLAGHSCEGWFWQVIEGAGEKEEAGERQSWPFSRNREGMGHPATAVA